MWPYLCVWLALAAGAGIFVGEQLALSPWACAAVVLVCVGASTAALARGRSCTLYVLLATVASAAVHAQRQQPPVSVQLPLDGTLSPPALYAVRLIGPTYRHATGRMGPALEVKAQLLARQQAADWVAERGRVRLMLRSSQPLRDNDTVLVRLQLLPQRLCRAPWQSGAAQQARYEQISARAWVRGEPVLLQRGQGLLGHLDVLRQRLGACFFAQLPNAAAQIASALALGDGRSLAPERRDAWADAGIAHLLAISGLHVSLVARLASGSLRQCVRLLPVVAWPFWPQRWAALLALVPVWLYAMLAGLGVSVLRAACMASVALLAQALGLGGNQATNALGLAALLLLWQNPLHLYAPGALLSFASVALLLGLPPLLPAPEPCSNRHPWAAACLVGAWHLGQALLIGSLASLITWPICAAYFGRVSWVAPLVNVVAIPIATLAATPAVLALAIANMLHVPPILLSPGCFVVGKILLFLDALAKLAASIPYAATEMPAWSAAQIVAATVLLLCALLAAHNKRESARLRPLKQRTIASVASLAVLTLLISYLSARLFLPARQPLRVWHLDVGQGDATLIGFADGQWALIDGGGALHAEQADPGRFAVAAALRGLGVRRLDFVVLTHPHPDHMGGLAYILQRWPVRQFYYNSDARGDPYVQKLIAQVHRRGGSHGQPPQRLEIAGTALQFYQPLQDIPASVNDRSIVLRIQHGARSLLVTGDIERRAEQALVTKLPATDVLQVAHHGSATSSDLALLRKLAPAYAIVSCGEHNRFSHPHPSVIDRLQRLHVQWWSTAQHGSILASTDGDTWIIRACHLGQQRGGRGLFASTHAGAAN